MYSQINVLYPFPARDASGLIPAQSLTVTVAAAAFATAFNTNDAPIITFDIQDYDVRVRWDGTDPTATVGHVLPASTAYTWSATQFNAAKFIRDTSATGNATIFASPMAN